MTVLGVILARAGSKGLPDKCMRDLLGMPVIAYTFEHARKSKRLTGVVLTTDSEPALDLALKLGVETIRRPADLASDTATVDAAARHAIGAWEQRHGAVVDILVLLYGNVPIRADGLIDRAVDHLLKSGAHSVRSVAPVGKMHPDWLHRLEDDRMSQFRVNSIYRRQDLEPLFHHDGAVVAVTRAALFSALDTPGDHQAFLGRDRRAIVQRGDEAVDIDEAIDFHLAEALLRSRALPSIARSESLPADRPSGPFGKAALHHSCGAKPWNETKDDSQVHLAPCVTIGDRRVGPGARVFIVAEAGVNHNGCLRTALDLVDAAAHAGADAVKFQVFRAAALATAAAPTAAYQATNANQVSQREMLSRLELSEQDYIRIADRCRDRSILFLATPFSPEDLGTLDVLSVPAIKIASTDLTNPPLLTAAARTGLPLILSTGASTRKELDEVGERLMELGVLNRTVLLHCISAYPAPLEALNLQAIPALARAFGRPVGFSDHTISRESGGWAVAAGACLLEKHFTLDARQAGPDHGMSLTPPQLKEYIEAARRSEVSRGTGALGMNEIEQEVRRVAGRSLVAAKFIPRGAVIEPEMVSAKRPAGGIHPAEIGRFVGRRARNSIPAETVLSWDMVH